MYKSYKLKNGIRIVTEHIPYFHSVSIGFWFRVGSAFEDPDENGLSHFIEHMMFKGTEERTARQIAKTLDSIGGQINAFTAKEYMCFYCNVVDEHIEMTLDLLSDMLLYSKYDSKEIDKEKNVILEEIDMYEDSPEDVVHELLCKAYFENHPLAFPILGEPEGLLKYSKSDILNFKQKYFTTDNLVIAVAGKLHEEKLISLIEKYLGNWQHRGTVPKEKGFRLSEPKILFTEKDIEQYHVSLSYPGITVNNSDLYPMLIMNNLLGGGMSSRLFQNIREERGLAYSVYSYPSTYLSTGMYSIYAATRPEQCEKVINIILNEIQLLINKGFTYEEFHIAKEQLKGNYILSNETTGSRMNAIGKAKTLLDKVLTPDQILEKINKVQPEDVREVIKKTFCNQNVYAALVGSEDKTNKIWRLINKGV